MRVRCIFGWLFLFPHSMLANPAHAEKKSAPRPASTPALSSAPTAVAVPAELASKFETAEGMTENAKATLHDAASRLNECLAGATDVQARIPDLTKELSAHLASAKNALRNAKAARPKKAAPVPAALLATVKSEIEQATQTVDLFEGASSEFETHVQHAHVVVYGDDEFAGVDHVIDQAQAATNELKKALQKATPSVRSNVAARTAVVGKALADAKAAFAKIQATYQGIAALAGMPSIPAKRAELAQLAKQEAQLAVPPPSASGTCDLEKQDFKNFRYDDGKTVVILKQGKFNGPPEELKLGEVLYSELDENPGAEAIVTLRGPATDRATTGSSMCTVDASGKTFVFTADAQCKPRVLGVILHIAEATVTVQPKALVVDELYFREGGLGAPCMLERSARTTARLKNGKLVSTTKKVM